ncbi:MAG: AarF/UbiB family protein [Bacillota bacterium]
MIFGRGSLKQLRHLRRYRRILRVLIKYGFVQILDQLKLYGLWERLFVRRIRRSGDIPHHLEARLRAALEELGPAFVKVGQLLSTRTDLLPPSYINELSRLQEKVPPFPTAKARQILEAELKAPLPLCFKEFDPEPIAAASIGQVHRAILPGGEEVAVKIKRPGVDQQIKGDLAILTELANLVDRTTNLGAVYRFSNLADELRLVIMRELDYQHEGRNAQRFRQNFTDNPYVYIPKVYWSHTTHNILTLEYREGLSLNRYFQDPAPVQPPGRIAESLTVTFFKQVFSDGFFHGDPHPGNIAILPDGRLFFMDFGAAGFINEELRAKFSLIFRAFQSVDTAAIVDELLNLTESPPLVNRSELIRDVGRIQEQYFNVPLRTINLGEAVQNIMSVAVKHRLRFPHEFLLLARALVTLEGTVARLDPEFSIAGVLEEYGPSLKSRQIRFVTRRVRRTMRSYYRLLEEIPERTVEILRETAAGELKLKVDVLRTESALRTLENMLNRLAFSIVLASLIIGLSQNLRLDNVTWLTRFPVGEAALIGAGMAGLWWLFAIIRSGRF